MIYLSATSIRDFLHCSKMYQYRKEYSEEAVDTTDAIAGRTVHSIIQKYWQEDKPNLDFLDALIDQETAQYNKLAVDREKMRINLMAFFYEFPALKNLLGENDLIEYEFEIKLEKDVTLVGRMDRIIKDKEIVIDWKTGSSSKAYINNSVQFITYYEVYRRLFGKPPTGVCQVRLEKQKVDYFYPEKKYIDTLFDSIIPKMVKQIRKHEYYKEGYFNGSCFNCSYIGVCNSDS